jgi:hypothetical protein
VVRAWILVPAALVLVAVLASCANEPGRLVADRRVRLESPEPGGTVGSPVEIRWSSEFTPGPESGLWFVVYLDTSMQPPGQSILPFAPQPCADVEACIASGQLVGPMIYLTEQTSLDVGELPPGPHRYFVTLVDGSGARQGDVAWNASFTVE